MDAETIVDVISEFVSGFIPKDAHQGLNPVHATRVRQAVRSKERLTLILPAFPAKSPNPEKTIGDLPDFGELIALRRLNALCKTISGLYGPGARIVICSDGRVFSDLVLVSDETISRYTQAIEKLILEERLEFLSVYHLDDALKEQDPNPEELRSTLLSRYADTIDTVREKVRSAPSFRALFNGMHRFVFEDRLVLDNKTSGGDLKSREKLRQESKEIAYELIRRSNAWSSLLDEKFPNAIRLSIHPQEWESSKLGVRLLPSEDRWRTPWHAVALIQDEQVSLVRRKDAEERGAQLYIYHERYPYFAFKPILEATLDGGSFANVRF